MECTESLFADIPTSDWMSVFCFRVPLMEIVMFRLIASTAISEQSSARISFFIRRAICRCLTIFGARCLFRSYCSLQPKLKISEVLSLKNKNVMKTMYQPRPPNEKFMNRSKKTKCEAGKSWFSF
jgi:hypothetical protein